MESEDPFVVVNPSEKDRQIAVELLEAEISKNDVPEDEMIVNEDDEDNFLKLSEWMINTVEIVPSLAKKYGQLLLEDGVGSINRLRKKLKKDSDYLQKVGIKEDDIEEITLALHRQDTASNLPKSVYIVEAIENEIDSLSARNKLGDDDDHFLFGPTTTTTHTKHNSNNTHHHHHPLHLDTTHTSTTILVAPHTHNNSTTARSVTKMRSGSDLGITTTVSEQNPISPEKMELAVKIKRFRQSVIVKTPSTETNHDATQKVENLKTAIEGKMDAAVLGVLNSIVSSIVSGNGEANKAFYHAQLAPVLVEVLTIFVNSAPICERSLQTVALLCRFSDEKKTCVSLENAHALGIHNISPAIAAALIKHANENRVLESACDAVRCLTIISGNRDRMGDNGVCEPIARALGMKRFLDSADTVCWICRSLGHLAMNNDANRARIGSVGVCETAISALQVHMTSSSVCTEVCWLIRHIAPLESNRNRIADEFGPETVISVIKPLYKDLILVSEACKALVACIASEDDEIISRIVDGGIISLLVKALRKNLDSEILATWIFNLFYYISCDEKLRTRLCGGDVMDLLGLTLEAHASVEGMAEWGCRTVHNLVSVDGVMGRMRNAGLCEMVVSCVQRQAISPIVCGYGCLAIGDLAMDITNHTRLIDSGACEAVIGSLKRHDDISDVVFQTCHGIHYLAQSQNNVSWIGANGGCEAVTIALAKHSFTSVNAVRSCFRAIGSLASNDEGNMLKFHAAGACAVIVAALKTHGMDIFTAEYGYRAIHNLCYENTNVSELGNKGACGLVSAGLQKHLNHPAVLTQACLATYGLAVKIKSDKVHNGNTRKLVTKGAIESVITAMKKYPMDIHLQSAAALAVASLARLEANREKLGKEGIVEIILTAYGTHAQNDDVMAKLTMATNQLCIENNDNKDKFMKGNIIEILLNVMIKHDKHTTVIGECLRTLVTLATYQPINPKLRTEDSFKLYIRGLRHHEKSETVSRWGCHLLYCCAIDDISRLKLGELKACDAVISVLQKHAVNNAQTAVWSCKALVALSLHDQNKQRFVNSETCSSVIKALEKHQEDPVAAEWICAAIVSLAAFESNRIKLGGACNALCSTLNKQMNTSEIVTRLACEAIYELCMDESNRHLFAIVGACELLVNILTAHIAHVKVAQQVCRAIAGLAMPSINISENANLLGAAGACQAVVAALKTHAFSTPMVEWACAAISALSDRNSDNQMIFYSMQKDPNLNVFKFIVSSLQTHRSVPLVCFQLLRATRSLSHQNPETSTQFSQAGIIPIILKILKVHKSVDYVVEHTCWILANIKAPDTIPLNEVTQNSISTLFTATEGGTSTLDGTPEKSVPLSDSTPDINTISTTTTTTAADSGPTRTIGSIPNSIELYKLPANWDILLTTLQINYQKQILAKWICAAISMFAEYGELSNVALCDAVLTTLTRHMDKVVVIMKALCAVGSLASCHQENKLRLVRGQAVETIDRILSLHTDASGSSGAGGGNDTIGIGVFCAIAGLAKDSPVNQNKFSNFPTIMKFVIKYLYNELESEEVSRWGCAAISALTYKNPTNQAKLSPSCYYIADILDAHSRSNLVAREACRTISILCHGNIGNRNRLGAADACTLVSKVFLQHISDKKVTIWAIKAIANLAANNPNNQTKLGNKGACEQLVSVLKKVLIHSNTGDDSNKSDTNTTMGAHTVVNDEIMNENVTIVKFTCWAIGNIVQLGKGDPTGTTEEGVSTKKNISLLYEAGVVEVLMKVLLQYDFDTEIVKWGARAINNISKNRTIKMELMRYNALQILNDVLNKYQGNKDVSTWIKLALDSIEHGNSSNQLGGQPDRTPSFMSPSHPSASSGDRPLSARFM